MAPLPWNLWWHSWEFRLEVARKRVPAVGNHIRFKWTGILERRKTVPLHTVATMCDSNLKRADLPWIRSDQKQPLRPWRQEMRHITDLPVAPPSINLLLLFCFRFGLPSKWSLYSCSLIFISRVLFFDSYLFQVVTSEWNIWNGWVQIPCSAEPFQPFRSWSFQWASKPSQPSP